MPYETPGKISGHFHLQLQPIEWCLHLSRMLKLPFEELYQRSPVNASATVGAMDVMKTPAFAVQAKPRSSIRVGT